MKKLIQSLSALLAIFSALMSGLLFIKNRAPHGFALWFPKMFAGALSPISALAGAVGGILGMVSGAPLSALFGGWGAYAAWGYLKKTFAQRAGLERAFGRDWAGRISAERQSGLLQERWDWTFPAEHQPRWHPDRVFWTLENGRKLLCNLWLPAAEVKSSGLAVLYFHGSAWTILDKDFLTRPIFRHLAAQGHVVMDVAYRLAPETDMAGMVADVKRALVWMKTHAAEYRVDPDKIVLMGSSAGGQLSLLAAYAPDHPLMTPPELAGADLSVRAVVSVYGPIDLTACYFHTNQDKAPRTPALVTPEPDPERERFMHRLMGDRYERWGFNKDGAAGSFYNLLGGHPDQIPEKYTLYSPVSYVHPGCPPTFLAQGEDDLMVPPTATRLMADRLAEAGVPVVNLIFPHTDHGFELALPTFNPAARVMLYELDRFLALMGN